MKARFFFLIIGVANLSLIIYGVLALLMPSILMEPFSIHVYQFPADAIGARTYLTALFRLIGFFNLVMGVLGLLILNRYRVTGREWHMTVVVIFTALAYIGPVLFDNTVGSIGVFEIVEHILFGLVIVVGLAMVKDRKSWQSPT